MTDNLPPGNPYGIPAPAAAPVVTPKKRSGGMTNVLLVGAACVAIGGVAFAGGRATAPTAAATGFRGGQGPSGSFNPGGFPGGGGGLGGGDASLTISGTVKSIDGTKLTITTANGTDTVVDMTSSTYHTASTASASDVTTGSSVSVTVQGFGGFRPGQGGPGSSAVPDASAGTNTLKATDITVTGAQ